MEYKTFLKNYCHKSLRLLPFSFFLLFIGFSSCSDKSSEEQKKEKLDIEIEYKRVPVSFFENGRPKSFNLFIEGNGKEVLTAFEELHENGAVKITGKLNPKGQRIGLWESFYEDGTPWSIGTFENDIENGVKKTWYPNGKLRYEGVIENGEPVGDWVFWTEKGVKSEKSY